MDQQGDRVKRAKLSKPVRSVLSTSINLNDPQQQSIRTNECAQQRREGVGPSRSKSKFVAKGIARAAIYSDVDDRPFENQFVLDSREDAVVDLGRIDLKP
ncbi:hypothetical protein D3C72_1847200 [compost metagenome]